MNDVEREVWLLATVRGALADFFAHDQNLLDLRLGEWAVTFRLGHHLVLRVGTDWDVDAEYDREGQDGAQKTRDGTPGANIRPDLLVHRRGQEERRDNLLFMEVKRVWPTESGDRSDLDKVHTAVRRKYQFGIALGLARPSSQLQFSPVWTVYKWTGGQTEKAIDSEDVYDNPSLESMISSA